MDGHDGDALVLNSSFAAAFGITVESDHQILVRPKCASTGTFFNVFLQRLSGSAKIKYYEMVLSSFGFVNTLSPPVNLSTDPRLINSMNFSPRFCSGFLKNGLRDRERWPKQQHFSHTSHHRHPCQRRPNSTIFGVQSTS